MFQVEDGVMDEAKKDQRPDDYQENQIGLAIGRVRSVIDLLEMLPHRSVELDRALERAVETDLWLKRHGNRGRLAE